MPKNIDRQRQEKAKNLAIQEKINADGQKKFEERKSSILGEAKEKVEKGIFEGGRTWKQQLDFTRHSSFSNPYNGPDRNEKKAKCCRLNINKICYKTVSYGVGKREDQWGCRECFGHWEVYKGF